MFKNNSVDTLMKWHMCEKLWIATISKLKLQKTTKNENV